MLWLQTLVASCSVCLQFFTLLGCWIINLTFQKHLKGPVHRFYLGGRYGRFNGVTDRSISNGANGPFSDTIESTVTTTGLETIKNVKSIPELKTVFLTPSVYNQWKFLLHLSVYDILHLKIRKKRLTLRSFRIAPQDTSPIYPYLLLFSLSLY